MSLGCFHPHHWSKEMNFTGSRLQALRPAALPGIPIGKSEWLLFLLKGQVTSTSIRKVNRARMACHLD